MVVSPEPPVVGALGDSKLTEDLTFGEGRGGYFGKDLRLLLGAHPLVPVASRGIGMAVFFRRYPSRERSPTNCLSSPFSLEVVYLLLSSVPHRVPGQPLLNSLVHA